MKPLDEYNLLIAHKLIQSLKKRNMEGFYCETKQDAVKKVKELMPENSVVAWGGSQSLVESGVLDMVKNGNYKTLDRDSVTEPHERERIIHEAFNADYYLMSTNAITLDGKLVNVDGNGNRIAALIYGPKHVIIVAGMNKVKKNEQEANDRVRNYAAPLNSIRLKRQVPCASTGQCTKCIGDGCICCQVLVTRMSSIKNRIKVILVGENLGY